MSSISLNVTKIILLVILVSTVSCRSVNQREEKDVESEVEDYKDIRSNEEDKYFGAQEKSELTNETKKQTIQESSGNNKKVEEIFKNGEVMKKETTTDEKKNESVTRSRDDENRSTNKNIQPNEEKGHHLDPTASSTINTGNSNNTRPSRTIPSGAIPTPEMMLENLRNKLKLSKSNLERKAAEPILSPQLISNPHTITLPTLLNTNIPKPTQNTPEETKTPAEEIDKRITSLPRDSSNNDLRINKGVKLRDNNEENEGISHLLHVRDEINKIRHMMQILKEHQIREQLGTQFPLSANLTQEETKSLKDIVDKLKEQGAISTKPISNNEKSSSEVQNHPPEASKLIEDVRKLKDSVLSFAKQVGGSKIPVGSIEDLEKQVQQQRTEIESLKKLVDELQPPKIFPTNPTLIKHPISIKTDLHEELRSLQEILSELLKKEEAKDELHVRNEQFNQPRSKPDAEIETIMKVFQTLRAQGRQTSPMETKLEKLEREIKDLDHMNQRTRHELLMQKLEHDIKVLQSTLGAQTNDKTDKKTINKISAIEKQLEDLNPQSKGLDIPASIEKELDVLQKEINLMTMKKMEKNGTPMSSKQLESLFSDILNQPSEDLSPAGSFDKFKPSPTHVEVSHDPHNPVVHLEIPEKINEVVHETSNIQYHQPPIFQIPFCLQKYHHPQSYPHPNYPYAPGYYHGESTIRNGPKGYNHGYREKYQNGYNKPAGQEYLKEDGQYGIQKEHIKMGVKPTNYNNGYEEPIKKKETYNKEPEKVQEYNASQEQYASPTEQLKIKTDDTGYNNEYKVPTKKKEGHYKEQNKSEKYKHQGQYGDSKEQVKVETDFDEYKEQTKTKGYYEEPVKAPKNNKSQGQYGEPKEELKVETEYNEYKKPTKNNEKYYEETMQDSAYNKPQGQYANPKEPSTEYKQGYQEPTKQIEEQNSYNEPSQDPTKIQSIEYEESKEYKNKYQASLKPTEYKEPDDQPMKQYGTKEQPLDYKTQNSYPDIPTSYNKNQKTESEQQYQEGIKPIDQIPIIRHIYKPKATPVKIEYHPHANVDKNQHYAYLEQIPYALLKPDIDDEINHLTGMIRNLDEKLYAENNTPNFELYGNKDYKLREKRALEDDHESTAVYTELKQRLANLRAALENSQDDQAIPNSLENELNSEFQRNAYDPASYQPYEHKVPYPLKSKKQQKFDNLFIKIVKFILHKLEISAPYVVQSLFDGDTYEYDTDNYENNYRNNKYSPKSVLGEGNDDSIPSTIFGGLFNSFQGFPGLLGFLPNILLKLLSNFSSFLTVLKRNSFIKNFLFPGALILAVDGIMAILAWWLSTDENHNLITFQNNTTYS